MNHRILSSETVIAMTPLLSRIGDDLALAYFAVEMILATDPDAGAAEDLAAALGRAQSCVDEFEQLGGTLHSYSPVCVDFIAEVDGEIGYVRWERGAIKAENFTGTDALCIAATAFV